jgi:hypothetical protein
MTAGRRATGLPPVSGHGQDGHATLERRSLIADGQHHPGGSTTPAVNHSGVNHPGARRATPPHLRRGVLKKNSPPDSAPALSLSKGGVAPEAPEWLSAPGWLSAACHGRPAREGTWPGWPCHAGAAIFDRRNSPDRMVAATAAYLRLPVISRDGRIKDSNIQTVW